MAKGRVLILAGPEYEDLPAFGRAMLEVLGKQQG